MLVAATTRPAIAIMVTPSLTFEGEPWLTQKSTTDTAKYTAGTVAALPC